MKEYDQTSGHHLPHHQGEEVDNVLKRLKKERNGFSGKYYAISKLRDKPVTLCLKLADSSNYLIPYSNITEVTFDIEAGICIYTAYRKYSITGRKIDELFGYLQSFRVEYICEHSGTDTGDKGIFIGSINATDR